MRSRMMVISKDELESVSNEGPVSSMEWSMDWMVSETAVNGTTSSLSKTSIR